jgi:DNA topoisomerase-1
VSPPAQPASGARIARHARHAARVAKLHYVTPNAPGFFRRGTVGKFFYVTSEGETLRSPAHLARIRGLAIPPAWTDVWICRDPDGHLQATGRDVKGRMQYRYHPRWRNVRDQAKYEELVEFARRLPRLRRRLALDLARPRLDKRKVLAAVVSLMEKSHARVGNQRYLEENGSFGLTTLQDRHARAKGSHLELHFRAKSGKFAHISIDDARLTRIVMRCRDIPGQQLFQYIDHDGGHRAITSTDVNEYIRQAMGAEFTAKTFRTWAGTFSAALLLGDCEPCRSEREAKRTITRVLEGVAEQLGNTPAICRKSYVHPGLFTAFSSGDWPALWRRARRARARAGLAREEAVMVAIFEWLHTVPPRAA